jgi:hypothetical protein
MPAHALPDPAFTAIAAHKAAYEAFDAACSHMSTMEGAIPKDRREEWFEEDRAKGLGANDDPRWSAALNAFRAALSNETRLAWTLARTSPAGVAGAAAALRYAADYADMGCEWPGMPKTEDGEEDWTIVFHQTLAAALEAIV